MKTFIFTITIVLFAAFNTVFGQSTKTLVKTIDNKGASVLVADLNGKVTVKETDSKFIRITTTIEASNVAEAMLQRLIEAGRYTIEANIDSNGNCTLVMPSIEKRVIIKGVDLIDVMSFEIEMPKGISFQNKNANISNVSNAPAL
jgi:hypothetical protein